MSVNPVQWNPNMKERILEMMREGALKCEIAAELEIPYSKFLRWRKQYEDFDEIIKLGETFSMAWWSRRGRVNLENPRFNHMLWYSIMKNAYGYGDKPAERYIDAEEWKGGIYEKIKTMDEALASGKMAVDQYQHLMRSLDFHTKINEIMYIAPAVCKIELQRKYDAGEIDRVNYEQEMFILEQNQMMREIAAENLMKEAKVASKFDVKQKRKVKNIEPKIGKKVKKSDKLENSYVVEKKPSPFLEQVKRERAERKKAKELAERLAREEDEESDEIYVD